MTDTRQQLTDIREWAPNLPALLTRRAPTTGTSPTPKRTPGGQPPIRLDTLQILDTRIRATGDDAEDRAWHDRMAGDHRQGLLPDLWQWARMIEAEATENPHALPAELPEPPTLTTVIDWLKQHLDWALAQHWAVELTSDIDWWWKQIRQTVGENTPAIPCRHCREPLEPIRDGRWECRTGHSITIRAVGLREAARTVKVNYETLRRWLAEENIARTETGGRPLYDMGEIWRVVATKRLRNAVV